MFFVGNFLSHLFAITLQCMIICCTGWPRGKGFESFVCNESIISRNHKKNGTITSPNYPNPYPSGIVCHYEFQAEGQERVQIRFKDMKLSYTAGDPRDPYGCPTQDSVKVLVYIDDKEEQLGEYCGEKLPPQLMSNGRKLKVIFDSKSNRKDHVSGFNIEYSFTKDFGVQGNGVQDEREVCTFMFRSSKHIEGHFTSPNYGGLYPRNTECHFIFYGKRNERVDVHFPEFEVDGIIPRCEDATDSDVVLFSNYLSTSDRKMPRYCGNRPRNKVVTSDAAFFKVTFKSNDKFDALGFKGIYKFQKASVETPYKGVNNSVTPAPSQDLNHGSRPHNTFTVFIVTLLCLCRTVILFRL